MKKNCKICGIEKEIEDYYTHKQMADGHLNICKECVKIRVRQHAHTEYGRMVEKKWLKTPKGKAKKKRHLYRFRKLNPDKERAHNLAKHALDNGKIKRQPCEICGDINTQKHHPDYSRPLYVRWLCFKHHRMVDKREIVLNIVE